MKVQIVACALVMAVAGLAGGLTGWSSHPVPAAGPAGGYLAGAPGGTTSEQVEPIAPECAAESACRYDHYQRLVRVVGIRPAIAQMAADAKVDENIQADCHNIFHTIGEAAAYLYWPDLAKAFTSGPVACGDGYHHGVLTTSIVKLGRTQELLEMLPAACDTLEAGSYEAWECFHGVGHAFYYYFEADMLPTYEHCMALKGDRYGCVSGATMGLSGDLGAAGRIPENPFGVCQEAQGVLDAKGTDSCLSMMSSILVQDRGIPGAIEFCNTTQRGPAQESCWQGVARALDGGRVVDGKDAEEHCDAVLTERGQELCVVAVATNNAAFFGNADRAMPYCATYRKPQYREWCEEYLANATYSDDATNAGFDGQFGEDAVNTPAPSGG